MCDGFHTCGLLLIQHTVRSSLIPMQYVMFSSGSWCDYQRVKIERGDRVASRSVTLKFFKRVEIEGVDPETALTPIHFCTAGSIKKSMDGARSNSYPSLHVGGRVIASSPQRERETSRLRNGRVSIQWNCNLLVRDFTKSSHGTMRNTYLIIRLSNSPSRSAIVLNPDAYSKGSSFIPGYHIRVLTKSVGIVPGYDALRYMLVNYNQDDNVSSQWNHQCVLWLASIFTYWVRQVFCFDREEIVNLWLLYLPTPCRAYGDKNTANGWFVTANAQCQQVVYE